MLSILTIYLISIAIIVVVSHLTFGRWWKHNELARRTMGHATVLGISYVFVPFGLIDLTTLLYITAATGISGAIIGAFAAYEHELNRREKAERRRKAALESMGD